MRRKKFKWFSSILVILLVLAVGFVFIAGKDDKDKKDKYPVDQEWKLAVSKNLDAITHAYEKITNKFRDIDNYILKDAKSKEEFIEKVKKQVEELPETSQQIFLSFLQSIE